MPKKTDQIIEPIDASLDEVAGALMQPAPIKSNKNKRLEKKNTLQPAPQVQGVLDLGIEVQKAIGGIEMGILENGIPKN